MYFHTIRINHPFQVPKNILLWYRGGFPTTNVSVESFLLPTRIYPNCKLTIRCDAKPSTLAWLDMVLKGKPYRIISDAVISPENIDYSQYDIIWNHDYWFCKGGASKKAKEEWKWILDNVQGPQIMTLYCDPLVTDKLRPTPNRKDWSNVMVIFNQDIIEDWAPSMFEGWESIEKKPFIAYINMRLYYNLPNQYKFAWHPYKTGVYFAHFHPKRIAFFKNQLEDFNPNLIRIGGRNSSALSETQFKESIVCDKFTQAEVHYHLQKGAWALYIGRVKPICWLGMTFYLPFLAGIPVFCYDGCTEAHKVFGNLPCYFKNGKELEELIRNTNFQELFYHQTDKLKSFYNINL